MIIGIGILYWPRDERISDRYGAVTLDRAIGSDARVPFDAVPIGARGRLIAVILATRPSLHCGDLARGIVPTTPTVGDQITLGTGTLFATTSPGSPTEIGLVPDDGRAHDWLDPHMLYRCHSQTVRLEFHPTGATGRPFG